TLQVPELGEKVAFLEGQGLRVVDKRERDSRLIEAFISPKSACGVIFQLAETQPALNNEPYWKRGEYIFTYTYPASPWARFLHSCAGRSAVRRRTRTAAPRSRNWCGLRRGAG